MLAPAPEATPDEKLPDMSLPEVTKVEDDQLEPPGTIAILGAGPLGLEAALYARSLGYQVSVFEAEGIGARLARNPKAVLPVPFRECSSPLGLAAIATQDPSRLLPLGETTLLHQEYLNCYLMPLANTDLLSDSMHVGVRVQAVQVEPWDDTGETDEGPLPPDLRLDLEREGQVESVSFECVIDTRVEGSSLPFPPRSYDPAKSTQPDLATGVPYLFRVGGQAGETVSYLAGLEQIRRLFAFLFGRTSLDLYRNARY